MDRDEISGKAYDLRLLGRLWAYLRPHRRTVALAVVFLVLGSLALLVQPYLLKIAIDHYVAEGDLAGLTRIALLFVLATAAELGFFYGQYYLSMVAAQRALAALRIDVFSHVQKLPMAYFDRNPVGRLVTRMTTDVDVMTEMFAAGALTIVMDALTLVGIVAVMFHLDARLALVSLAMMPLMLLAIDFFRRRARSSYRLIRERIARINAYLQEAISGMGVIQLFGREQRAFREFDALNDAHRESNHLSNIYEASLFSLVEAMSSISVGLAVWYASGRIVDGAIAFGTLVAFVEYIQKFFVPIRDFSTKYAVMQSAMAAAERVFALLDVEPPPVGRREYVPAKVEGRVAFENVSFAYRGGEWVLRDVSFHVDPGETIAIVGATGSGKTSMIKILAGFYEAQRGTVAIDGIDVRHWDLGRLRRAVAIVLQDVVLFRGTVAENVGLGRPEIDRERIEAAARAVNAHGFVSRLPLRYDEPVRERGNNFSSGQRQLLSFARALAHDPAILVLDEATSSVDPETEAAIQDALDHLLVGRTAIVIAHRLSTIERADRILVLHHGELREIGTHRELLDRGGIYARLHRLQFRGRNETETEAAHPPV
jgi:ATP-binding cassette, subfamily B, multidrug efflux pump